MTGSSRAVVATVDDKVGPAWLAVDRVTNCRLKRCISLRLAQRCSQIRRVLLTEAHKERTGAGHPHPVATLAKIMSQRSDKAEPPAGLADGYIARRPPGAVVTLIERPPLLQPGTDQ